MTYAPFYLDQLNIIENLSKSLPITYRLIVKEHPSMLGRRSKEYYRRLNSLPNVKMINPKVNSIDIIKKSEAIFTITGTVGLEGLILKKPVIVLGSCYFKYCPLVIDAGDVAPTKWPQIIEKALKKHKHDEKIFDIIPRGHFRTFFPRNVR